MSRIPTTVIGSTPAATNTTSATATPTPDAEEEKGEETQELPEDSPWLHLGRRFDFQLRARDLYIYCVDIWKHNGTGEERSTMREVLKKYANSGMGWDDCGAFLDTFMPIPWNAGDEERNRVIFERQEWFVRLTVNNNYTYNNNNQSFDKLDLIPPKD